MPDNTDAPRPESALPTIGERVELVLSLLHPGADDLAATAAEHVTTSQGVSVTTEHITALLTGDVASVPDPVLDAVVTSTQMTSDSLFGNDPETVRRVWSNLRVIQELHDATPGLIQLRAGSELSPQAREDLLRLLDPSRQNQSPPE